MVVKIVLFVLVMCFSLTACSTKTDNKEETQEKPVEAVTESATEAAEKAADEEQVSESVGMANPVVEYGSLEEINEKIDVKLLKPQVMGVSNERYSIINDTIAQYECEINGREWIFRAAHITDEDISGMYNEHNVFTPNEDSGLYVNEFYLDRFFDADKQYTIVAMNPISEDGEQLLGEDAFQDCCMELKMIQKRHMDDPAVGTFQNTEDERMVLYVERMGENYYASVNLNSSDKEFKCWTLQDVAEDGDKLTYKREEIGEYTYDDEGNEASADVTTVEHSGYFEIKDGKMYWTGAAQEECRSYIFEKIF